MPSPIPDEGTLHGQAAYGPLWAALDDLLDRARPDGILLHGLGPLGAKRLRARGLDVPSVLQREERSASLFGAIANPLLRRIRESCEGPLILFKGQEIAQRYPPGGRGFSDIDLLTPLAEATQRALLESGFVADDQGLVSAYHLQPLLLEAIPLQVEVHESLKWPEGLSAPSTDEILEASVPSSLGIEGVFAPSPAHHALIVAAHSWRHRPLRLIRDMLDAALLAADLDEREVARTAASWGIGRIWQTTRETFEGLFYGGRTTVPLRSWARHLGEARERTVLESHLEHWMSPFWGMPLGRALRHSVDVLRDEVARLPDETWGEKLRRTREAVRHPLDTLSRHEEALLNAGGSSELVDERSDES